eukprot:6213546-Pleurochrysis_carterae.AAC.2
MLLSSGAWGGCTKWRLGSGTATSFLRWCLAGRELSFSRRYGTLGKCRPPPVGCAVASCRAKPGAYPSSSP